MRFGIEDGDLRGTKVVLLIGSDIRIGTSIRAMHFGSGRGRSVTGAVMDKI